MDEYIYVLYQLFAFESRKYLLAHFVFLLAIPVNLDIATDDTPLQPLPQVFLLLGRLLHIRLAEAAFPPEILVYSISVLTCIFLGLNFPTPLLNCLIKQALDVKSLPVAFYFLDRGLGHQKERILLMLSHKYSDCFLQVGHFLEE